MIPKILHLRDQIKGESLKVQFERNLPINDHGNRNIFLVISNLVCFQILGASELLAGDFVKLEKRHAMFEARLHLR